MQAALRLIDRLDSLELARIYCVDPAMVQRVWDRVRSRFVDVIADYPTDTTIEATEQDVLSGMQLLWVAFDGIDIVASATTSLCLTPARKLCMVTLAFGVHTKLWDQFMPMVERYARAEGCSNIRLSGRSGWKRVLKDFSEPWVVLDKELN